MIYILNKNKTRVIFVQVVLESRAATFAEFSKFIGPRGQKIMRSANNVGNAGPHVRQTFLNDVFTFLSETQVVL